MSIISGYASMCGSAHRRWTSTPPRGCSLWTGNTVRRLNQSACVVLRCCSPLGGCCCLQTPHAYTASNPRRWLKRVAQMAQRLRGYPPPRQAQLPKSIGAAMSAYISAVHSRSIAVADNRSSLPFRPRYERTHARRACFIACVDATGPLRHTRSNAPTRSHMHSAHAAWRADCCGEMRPTATGLIGPGLEV